MTTRTSVFRCLTIGLALLVAGVALPPPAPAAGKSAAAAGAAQNRSAEEWFRKGALVSTYGNNTAAVGYFASAAFFACVWARSCAMAALSLRSSA